MLEYVYCRNNQYVRGEGFSYNKYTSKKDHKKIAKTDFITIFAQDPKEDEIKRLCEDFNVFEKHFQRFRKDVRSLRYSLDPLVFTFIDYFTENLNKIRVSHLLFIIKDNVFILVVSDTHQYYKDLFNKVVENSGKRKQKKITYILYEFLYQTTKENYEVIEKSDDKLAQIEKRILESRKEDKTIMHDVVSIKKELNHMVKRFWASSKIIFTLKKELTSIRLGKEEFALLDDIYDTLLHQIDLVETQKETVTDYIEIFTSTISNRLAEISNELNIVMKKMTALTIIIMVPTLIAGVYGTNFVHFPEIHWALGYLWLWGFMLGAASLMYYFFHKRGWI